MTHLLGAVQEDPKNLVRTPRDALRAVTHLRRPTRVEGGHGFEELLVEQPRVPDLDGQHGGIAAAVSVGERSGMPLIQVGEAE